MEMNASHTLFHVLRKFPFADLIEPEVVRKSTGLMELTEELVNLKSGVVHYELVPEGALLDGPSFMLKVADDFLEVPRECKNIGMLLLTEGHINSKLLVFLLSLGSELLLLFKFDFGSIEPTRNLALESLCSE